MALALLLLCVCVVCVNVQNKTNHVQCYVSNGANVGPEQFHAIRPNSVRDLSLLRYREAAG